MNAQTVDPHACLRIPMPCAQCDTWAPTAFVGPDWDSTDIPRGFLLRCDAGHTTSLSFSRTLRLVQLCEHLIEELIHEQRTEQHTEKLTEASEGSGGVYAAAGG